MAPKTKVHQEPPPGLLPDGTLNVVTDGQAKSEPTIIDDDTRVEDFDDLEREFAATESEDADEDDDEKD